MSRAVKSRIASVGASAALRDACRVALLQIDEDRRSSLGVTSAIRGEGRSTIASALASTLVSDFNRPTVLLDLDFADPTLSSRHGAVDAPGVGDVLAGDCRLEDVLQELEPGLSLLAAGGASDRSPQYLAMRFEGSGLMERFAAMGRSVVADLPPALESVAGPTLARAFSQVIMVVRARVTPVRLVRAAVATLPSAPEVLLNGTPEPLPSWLARLVGD
ncbi:MAG: hypothetical protein M3024_10850 [Candidatus Dormibacteraeota bacterium]|nr:hypothetical protein [Candidatus Dormibacteraeota bacterium]